MGESLFDRWGALMTEAGWAHFPNRPKSVISCFSTNDTASFRVQVHCDPAGEEVVAMITFERRCPPAYRQTMFEIVNYLNAKRVGGGFFAVDPRDGEVRYRQAQLLCGVELTAEFVDAFMKLAVSYVTVYYDVVQKGLQGFSLQGAKRR
jgi:hypothetical protein